MKNRYLALSVGVLALLAIGWLLRSQAPAVAATTFSAAKSATDLSSATVVVAPVVKPASVPQVVAPKAAPVAAPAQPVVVVDNQKELSTAIPELVKFVQSGDLVTAWQMYARPDFFADIPPERHAQVDEHLRNAMSTPDGQMRVQIMGQILDSFNTQTPAYDESGNLATYQVSGPAASVGLKQIRFQKINGRWYIADNDLGQIGRLLGL